MKKRRQRVYQFDDWEGAGPIEEQINDFLSEYPDLTVLQITQSVLFEDDGNGNRVPYIFTALLCEEDVKGF